MSKQLEMHPAAELFPPITGDEFDALRDDIKANGLRVPIVLFEGKILDGRNRYLACCALGVEPKFQNWKGDDPTSYVVSLNIHRRHLTESQRALIGARVRERFEAEAARRRKAAQNNTAGRAVSANLRELVPAKSSEQAAELVNVSPRSVETASKVLKDGAPELVKAIEAGDVTVSAAAAVSELPKPEQAAAVKEGPKAVREKAAEIRKGKSKVNGVLVDDPPDVAKARAAGRLAADVVPEVAEPGTNGDAVEDPEPAEADDALSDEEWLNTLPVRHALTGRQRSIFDADALAYRRLAKARGTFKHHAVRVLNKTRKLGEYGFRVRRFLSTDHPRHWLVCAPVTEGGCGGHGEVTLIGECTMCRGKGYWIK
jgi:hypothetical protein